MAYAQAHRLPLPSEASSSRTRLEEVKFSFDVDQAKLNPTFEAYKLIQDDTTASSGASSYGLPSRPPRLIDLYQSHQEARREDSLLFTGLGYKETKERALHQVLVPSKGQRSNDEPFAGYVDANDFVVVLTYDPAKDRVVGHPVLRLARNEHLKDGHMEKVCHLWLRFHQRNGSLPAETVSWCASSCKRSRWERVALQGGRLIR